MVKVIALILIALGTNVNADEDELTNILANRAANDHDSPKASGHGKCEKIHRYSKKRRQPSEKGEIHTNQRTKNRRRETFRRNQHAHGRERQSNSRCISLGRVGCIVWVVWCR